MFSIEVCPQRRAALIRFGDDVSESDFETLEGLARERQGSDEYDVIFDFTAVQLTQLTTDYISKRGGLPQVFNGRERIYVAPQHDLKLLVRLYAAYQQSNGWNPPVVVDTLDQAAKRLGINTDDFHRVTLPP